MKCPAEDCSIKLRSDNTTGYCYKHRHLSPVYKESRREYLREWDRSEKGKAKARRHKSTEAYKQSQRKYARERLKTEAGREVSRNAGRNRYARKRAAITGPLPKDLTGYLGNLYGWTCQRCDCGLTRETLTVDHVVPLAVFPMHVLFNFQPLCGPCNSQKRCSLNHLDDRELSLIAILKGGGANVPA